jgi:CrcB protein
LRPAPPRTILLRGSITRSLSGPVLYLYLAAGGVAGTLARYGLGKWIPGWAGTGFPWATLAINLAGSLVLGFAVRAFETLPVAPEVRGMVAVGFCGAFTTFSTFGLETVTLMQEGQWARASLYAAGSVALGLLAVFAGMALAGAAFRPRA